MFLPSFLLSEMWGLIVNYILYLLEEKIALHVRQFPSPASVLICLTFCVITKRTPSTIFQMIS